MVFYILGGGWTVIQQHINARVSFERKWVDYKHGFGSFAGSFWFGNDRIHNLTNSSPNNAILIDFVDASGIKYQPAYTNFHVEDESTGYILRVGDLLDLGLGDFSSIYSNFKYHSGMKFSTMDVDNDEGNGRRCSGPQFGNAGWWFKDCNQCLLNGRFGVGHGDAGMTWDILTYSSGTNLLSSRMLVRRM